MDGALRHNFFPPPTSSRRDTHVWKKRVGDLDHLRAAEGRRRPSLRLLLVSASDHTARLRPYRTWVPQSPPHGMVPHGGRFGATLSRILTKRSSRCSVGPVKSTLRDPCATLEASGSIWLIIDVHILYEGCIWVLIDVQILCEGCICQHPRPPPQGGGGAEHRRAHSP